MINIGVDGCKYDSVVRRLGRLGDKRHGEPQFIGSGIKTGQPSWKCRTPGVGRTATQRHVRKSVRMSIRRVRNPARQAKSRQEMWRARASTGLVLASIG